MLAIQQIKKFRTISGAALSWDRDQNGIVGTFHPLIGLLTLSGKATVAQYQAALQSVAYVNNSELRK